MKRHVVAVLLMCLFTLTLSAQTAAPARTTRHAHSHHHRTAARHHHRRRHAA